MSVEFARATVSAEERQLRLDVRAFLAKELPKGDGTPGLGMGAAYNPAFSAKLAAQGWVGMAIPKRYGGHDRRAFDRFVVVEELLAWGAPVSAHWVADRQSAQTILSYGTEDQKQQFLPEIAGGRCFFSIGTPRRRSPTGSPTASRSRAC